MSVCLSVVIDLFKDEAKDTSEERLSTVQLLHYKKEHIYVRVCPRQQAICHKWLYISILNACDVCLSGL